MAVAVYRGLMSRNETRGAPIADINTSFCEGYKSLVQPCGLAGISRLRPGDVVGGLRWGLGVCCFMRAAHLSRPGGK